MMNIVSIHGHFCELMLKLTCQIKSRLICYLICTLIVPKELCHGYKSARYFDGGSFSKWMFSALDLPFFKNFTSSTKL